MKSQRADAESMDRMIKLAEELSGAVQSLASLAGRSFARSFMTEIQSQGLGVGLFGEVPPSAPEEPEPEPEPEEPVADEPKAEPVAEEEAAEEAEETYEEAEEGEEEAAEETEECEDTGEDPPELEKSPYHEDISARDELLELGRDELVGQIGLLLETLSRAELAQHTEWVRFERTGDRKPVPADWTKAKISARLLAMLGSEGTSQETVVDLLQSLLAEETMAGRD